MKNLKKLLFLAVFLAMTGLGFAANDSPISVNFGQTDMGVVRHSTEARNIRTGDEGSLYTLFGTNRSSWTNATTVGSTLTVTGVDSNSRNINVLAVASSSQPVLVVPPLFGQLSAERIRIYDCRGVTSTAVTLFDKIVTSTDSSSNFPNFSVWATSGVTVVKSGTGDVIWRWYDPNQKVAP